MGIYKRCDHKGRDRDRCDDEWYASYLIAGHPRARVALAKWTGRDVKTKTDALKAFDDLKTEVRASRFNAVGLGISRPDTSGSSTFAYLLQQYTQHHVKAKQLRTRGVFDYRAKPVAQEFASAKLSELTTARIEAWQARLREQRVEEGKSVAWLNRQVGLLKTILLWGVKRELIAKMPDISLDKEDYSRWRRVSAEEETRLLEHAHPTLRLLIVLALDTGMRRGEMLALRVGDVDLDVGVIRLRGATTKSAETRDVPILTERLRGVLAWLRQGDRDQPRPALAPLIESPLATSRGQFRYYWECCQLQAYGYKVTFARGEGMSRASRKQFQEIDLHWHDLRHEFACRLDDRGNSLGRIQRILGHANIATTERYLRRGFQDLQAIKLDDGTLPDCLIVSHEGNSRTPAAPPSVALTLPKTGTSG